MSVIDVRNVSFRYDGAADYVFENFSVRLDTGWKLGLVGRNGRGKTTLLGILAGRLDYTGTVAADTDFVSFPCELAAGTAVCEAGEAAGAETWKFLRELSLLGSGGLSDRVFGTLSPGERTRVMLAVLFARDGAFPLIDEPTDNLDADGRRIVAAYLRDKPGFILVSHDRAFLDACTDHTLALNRTGAEIVKGGFSVWYGEKTARDAAEAARNEFLKSEIDRLGTAARRAADWSDRAERGKYGTYNSGLKVDRGYVGHKAAKMMQRAKATERRLERTAEEKSALLKDIEVSAPIRLFPHVFRAETLVTAKGLCALYGGRASGRPADFEIKRGDRLRIRGGNGSGKSSLLRLVADGGAEYAGTLSVASGLTVSYVPQSADRLAGTIADIAAARGLDAATVGGMLHRLGLDMRRLGARIETWSAGQKKKALLALSLCESADLYVWDEPLNYVDVISRMQIEEAVKTYRPTMLFVEHDEKTAEGLATAVLDMNENRFIGRR